MIAPARMRRSAASRRPACG